MGSGVFLAPDLLPLPTGHTGYASVVGAFRKKKTKKKNGKCGEKVDTKCCPAPERVKADQQYVPVMRVCLFRCDFYNAECARKEKRKDKIKRKENSRAERAEPF